MSTWDPNYYLRFGNERTRPSIDLVSRIAHDDPATIVDLGCGPGNSTHALRKRWPKARVYGLDNSPEMIEFARRSQPDLEWVVGHIETWSAEEPHDIVFANASLQWVRNHVALVGHLFRQVAQCGALAFQIPSADFAPVRTFIHEIADDRRWTHRMDDARTALTMEHPQVYYDALAPRAKSVDVWETEYHHVMESPAAIVEWMSGTGLRPFLKALDSDDDRQQFVTLLTQRVAEFYLTRSDGRVLFPFKRTFVIAYR